MVRLGSIITGYIEKIGGSTVLAQQASVEEFKGDKRKLVAYGPYNEDFGLTPNTKTIDVTLGTGRGSLISIAYANQAITPVALAGERRIYSTNAAGDTLKAVMHFKQDGTIEQNGSSFNLTMWQDLNTQLQLFITAFNAHKHGGGSVPDVPQVLDITGARADTLKTDG